MPTAKMTTRGRVTVPREIRERLGLRPGDRVEFRVTEGGEVVVEAAAVDFRDLRGIFKWDGPPVSLEEMEVAVRRAGIRL